MVVMILRVRKSSTEEVAAEVKSLSDELTAAVAAGDLAKANDIQRRLTRALGRFNNAIAVSASGDTTARSGPTQREIVIGIVAGVGDATPARVVRDIAALDGTPIKNTGFPSILRSDQRSWHTNPQRKPLLVLPGLEAATLAPMSSWATLSSFAPAQRVIAPLTPRAAHLRSLLYIVDRLTTTPASTSIADALVALARRWASALPETRVFGAVDPTELRGRITDTLHAIAAGEASQRQEAAERIAASPPDVALFGFRNLTVVETKQADVP